ncbi:unnamed protein product [Rhizophagus irregularis]|nr:unnamed protein product [Rhizophagus irregularis]
MLCHIISSVKNRLVEKNTNIAIIPGGCTSKLQPLNIAINKSFKAKDNVDEDLIRRFFKCCEVSTNTDGSEDNDLFDYDKLLDMLKDDDEVDINNSDGEENEYTEENDYENEWKIETDKGKNKENNGGNDSSGEDGNQNQELTSDEK